MQLSSLHEGDDVFFVAEIGNNHEGSFTLAQEMVGKAAEAGAHAVKFQTFVPEKFQSSADEDRLERLRGFALPGDAWEKLARQAADLGVVFFSTPLDLESARVLAPLCPVFKIASGDNTFTPLIETVAGFGKPVVLSTGLADMADVQRAVDTIKAVWSTLGVTPDLALLHCVCSYPVPPEQANLSAIGLLRDNFDCIVGYSDHCVGIEAALAAVALGAKIVEKHFTVDKNLSSFRDHQLSADPGEMKELIERSRRLAEMIGSGQQWTQPCEEELRLAVRRSVAAGKPLKAGHVLGRDDLTWVRPGTGVPVGEEDRLIGRAVRKDMVVGELILPEDVA